MMALRMHTINALLLVVLIPCQFVTCPPIPIIPPGCHDLCVKLGGTFLECIKDCPPIEKCVKAMTMVNLTEVYMNNNGPVKRPQLCKYHCWESNMYTERRCMLDCPLTWCRQYGKVPSVTTTTPVMTAKTTALTQDPTLERRSADADMSPVQDGAIIDGTGPTGWTLVGIVLGTLASVMLLVVITYMTARWCYKKYLAGKSRKLPKESHIPMSSLPATNRDEEETYLRS